jgi:hypothetical protein
LEQLTAEKLQADVNDRTFFARALDLAFADIVKSNGGGEPVVFDADPEALRLIKHHLSDENARLLDERLDARVRTREARSFELLLYGPAKDDWSARRSLTEALKLPSPAIKETLGAAVEKGLGEARLREVMFRRFVPSDAKFRADRDALLSATERLFDNLPVAVRGRFVEELFRYYGGEDEDVPNALLIIARDAFQDLRRDIDGRDGDDSKGPKTLKGRPFGDTLLRFVSANEFARNRLAVWVFAESPQKIDRYLSDYPRKWDGAGAPSKTAGPAPAEGQSAEANDGGEAAEAAPPGGKVIGWLKRTLNR